MRYSIHLKRFIFDGKYLYNQNLYIDRWLVVAAGATLFYSIFALVLIGVPGLSRGGVVAALFCMMWMAYGKFFKHRHFPVVLWIPLSFFAIIFALGFQVDYYPVEPVGKLVTVWFGSIAIAMFVANGLSVRFVIACFAMIVVCNLLAYALGYDARSIRLANADSVWQYASIKRITALAGQSNLLVALIFTFPFSLFLLRDRLGTYTVTFGLALCTSFMFLTASRSTIPFTFLFLIFSCILFIKTPLLKLATFLIGTSVLLIISYIMLTFPIHDLLANSSLAKLEIVRRILEVLDNESGSISTRLDLAKSFAPYFNAQPFLGYGPDQFKVEVGGGSYAHNNAVELLINYGLLGTIVYYSMYIVVISNIIMIPRLNVYLVAPLFYLMSTDFVFITHVERPLALLLCLLLIISSTPYRRS